MGKTENEAVEFLKFYNRLTIFIITEQGKRKPRFINFNKNNLKISKEIITELLIKNIPINPYLVSCFAKSNWTFRPALKNLLNKTYINYFIKNSNEAFVWLRNFMQEDQITAMIDLPRGWEIVKQRFKSDGAINVCRVAKSFTGGFNNLSPICRECSLRRECAGD